MKLYCLLVIVFVVWLSFVEKGLSQFGTTPQIINFPKTEYNASNQNWSIDQDSIGNIYVANNKGLLVYNGAWSLYELPGQQIVRSVACDNKGRVYTGGFGEFGYWEKELLGDYVYHSLTKNIHYDRFSKEEIWKISKIENKIYFQSFSTIYVLENNKVTPIPCPGNVMYAFSINGHIYVQILKKGLFELKNKSFLPIVSYAVFQQDEIISLMKGPGNTVVVGSVHNGLFRLDRDNNTVEPFSSDINSILKKAQLNAAIRLTDSTFAIGTIQRGIYILDNQGKILEHFDQQNGLQNNTVLALKKDLAGNLWAGMDRGLDQIVLQSPFRYFQDVNGEIGSIYAVAWYNGVFYIGSNDGLYSYDPASSKFRNVGGINWQVWSLDVLDGQLFCAHNSGVTVIDNHGISNIPNMPGGWSIRTLHSNSNFALQGTYIGLSVYQKGADGHFHYKQSVKGLATMPLSDWLEDKKGYLWLKHAYKGISKVRLNDIYDSVVQMVAMEKQHDINPDIQQNIGFWLDQVYVISKDGVKIWNEPKNKFENVSNLFGLSNNYLKIKRVFPITKQCFWVVKDDNQLAYTDALGHTTSFYLKDFSLVSGYENVISLDSTRCIICGENGFALFSLDLLHMIPSKTTPIISSVFINRGGEFLPISELAKNSDSNWEINYDNRSIKIIAGNFVFDRRVQYRFKLNKYGEPGYWSEWQNATAKVYTNLPAGDYKVEVQTNIAAESAYFEFTVLPPWYWTWWSKLLYFGFFVLTIIALYRKNEKRYAKNIQKKQFEMEKMLSVQKMQHEHELLLVRQEKLEQEVQLKSEDLANSANELIKRKKLLNKMHIEIEKQKEDKEKAQSITSSMKKLSKELERQLKLDKEETKLFEHGFNTVHENFFSKLLAQYPNLTPQDLKLAAYLRMNFASKEIAPLLNITVRGVELKRYRLRKKMELADSINLNEFMMKL